MLFQCSRTNLSARWQSLFKVVIFISRAASYSLELLLLRYCDRPPADDTNANSSSSATNANASSNGGLGVGNGIAMQQQNYQERN
jgi:hypothetical protein